MLDAANIQALAAFGAMLLAQLTLMGGWTWWMVNRTERNLREEMRLIDQHLREEMRLTDQHLREEMRLTDQYLREEMRRMEQNLQEEMRRNHRESMALLQYHTHGDDGAAVFHRLPETGD